MEMAGNIKFTPWKITSLTDKRSVFWGEFGYLIFYANPSIVYVFTNYTTPNKSTPQLFLVDFLLKLMRVIFIAVKIKHYKKEDSKMNFPFPSSFFP